MNSAAVAPKNAVEVVSILWIKDSIERGEVIPITDDYIPTDIEQTLELGMGKRNSVQIRKFFAQNKRKLENFDSNQAKLTNPRFNNPTDLNNKQDVSVADLLKVDEKLKMNKQERDFQKQYQKDVQKKRQFEKQAERKATKWL